MTRTTTTGESDMTQLELFRQHMAELYWLAFLITGNEDQSVDAFTDAVLFDEPAPTSRSMLCWVRKLVIVAALDAVRSQVRESKHRTQMAARNCDPYRGL